jgi:hypothetical protein
MRHQLIAWCSLALVLASITFARTAQQEITAAPSGPFHVDHAQIVDSAGRPFLMRGTQLTDFHPRTAIWDNHAGPDYGAHSATSLTAVRLRFNMNTVRLPLDISEAIDARYFTELAKWCAAQTTWSCW